ncbi:MAG TPA: tRNA (N6-threonylcarbamoyladenosine(37)-N6)-methyltransferase TrmO [Bacteroidota bacterium]|nr:tRNA (N6-threonylcarbamoyladenosine(37)-N6)-methyltransferase TrmO [Bacteroidota bacterium]
MNAELVVHPIGVVRSPFTRKSETPRQPGLGGAPARGRILLDRGRNFEQSLKDLEGFERIWLLAWFDRSEHWKPMVLPPGSRKKHGLFATRSPHRPNPIGLSLCRLLAVKGRTLYIEGLDLLDGTPVLDIKPYLPYIEAYPHARSGWADAQKGRPRDTHVVHIGQTARDQMSWLLETYGVDLETPARTVLRADPFPHPYRRIKAGPGDAFTLSVRSWRIIFHLEHRIVRVERVLSGYAESAVRNITPASLHDGPAHVAFHEHWPKQSQ